MEHCADRGYDLDGIRELGGGLTAEMLQVLAGECLPKRTRGR
jgi:hypothetical protein